MVDISINNWKRVSKDLNLGKIIYRFYYAPKGFLKECLRIGVVNMAIDRLEKYRMERAAYCLPAVEPYYTSSQPLDIHFLSGKKFWYQTCFCAYSMVQQTRVNIRPVIYDDGTLTPQNTVEIKRIFPNAKIVFCSEIEAVLDKVLPVSKFPYLRQRRIDYPHIRKLIDVHIVSDGWKLVLDSDMLFFRTPKLLIDWLSNPQKSCYMVDKENSYGYSQALMSSLAKATLPKRLNVGICGLKSNDIDWEKLEFWCKATIEKEGTHYYQEQALVAMLVADKNCLILPESDYIVMPDKEEGINPQAILHHYVADSKPWYFRYGWKRVLFQQTSQS